MSELRQNPLSGRWVVLAPDRARRPDDFRPPADSPGGPEGCPFCPGREELTPPETLARRADDGWSVRVVPNRYPSLRVEAPARREAEGVYQRMAGLGAHEVVIETPRHRARWSELGRAGIRAILEVWSERLRDLRRDRRLQYGLVFRNEGARAGATLAHPHSQIIALPLLPATVEEERARAREHFTGSGRCLTCDIVAQERGDRHRMILENERCVAFAPWAPRFPFETWVLPRAHASRLEGEPPQTLEAVAEVLCEVVDRLDRALERPAWNLVLHGAPLQEEDTPWGHWRIELLPTLTRPGGFEWGSGFHINPVPPEESAGFLRQQG